jgi:hypothetical protein
LSKHRDIIRLDVGKKPPSQLKKCLPSIIFLLLIYSQEQELLLQHYVSLTGRALNIMNHPPTLRISPARNDSVVT